MPELPEVEVVRRGLAEHATGRVITDATVTGHRVTRRHEAGPVDLVDRLRGARIEAVDRRGKFLWLVAARPGQAPEALNVHLGMSGQMLVADQPGDGDQPELPKHTHARLLLDDGRELRFVDQRTFGGLHVNELGAPVQGHPHGIPASVQHIAPDPFEPLFDADAVARDLKRRRAGIKRLLLTQTIVSGIGNIYADEALWRAGIHGERPADALTRPALRRTLEAAREVMGEALQQGGTSFDALYVNVNGQSGYFDRRLAVYGQQGRPCPRCGTPVVRAQFMNRSSHWCPRCQTAPRGLVRHRSPGARSQS